jgi:hypothetical protein
VSHPTHTIPSPADAQRFQDSGGLKLKAAIIGAIGLAASLGGILVSSGEDRRAALYGYLVSFAYWAGIAFGALVLVMIFHAFRSKWTVVVRRPAEAMATTLVLFLLLAIPLLLGLEQVYPWVHPHDHFHGHEVEILEKKEHYLNVPFFIGRTIGYLVISALIAWRLFGLSTRQDVSGDVALTQKQRNLGTGALPLVGLLLTFAAVDWLMTLNPLWFSTIFGVYYFAGSFWSTLAVLIIVTTLARGKGLYGDFVSVEHLHNLGKLLFAFTCFWGYIAFSQMMLIWIANLPEEIPFFQVRMQGPWAAVGVVLIIGHFVLPFGLLLSRELKRTPNRLRLVAVWALVMNLLDIYWLVMPSLDKDTPRVPWTMLLSFVGIGALGIAFALWRIRGHFTLPVKDPFLPVSLRYRQPT